jgi:hypothetical protein
MREKQAKSPATRADVSPTLHSILTRFFAPAGSQDGRKAGGKTDDARFATETANEAHSISS